MQPRLHLYVPSINVRLVLLNRLTAEYTMWLCPIEKEAIYLLGFQRDDDIELNWTRCMITA